MTNPRWWAGVVTLMFAAVTPALAQQQSAAGRVKTASGAAFIVRQGAHELHTDAIVLPHPGLADRDFWQRELIELRGDWR